MEIINSETSLVVAGAWNPAILNPQWVIKHGLLLEPDDAGPVQAFLPAIQGLAFEFPRYVLPKLTYVVRGDALLLYPLDCTPTNLAIVEKAAFEILKQLNHTPISGIGHNFEFRDPDPKAEWLTPLTTSRQDLADNLEDGWNPTGAGISSTFTNLETDVQVNIQRQLLPDGALSIRFNFHHQTVSREDAMNVLSNQDGYASLEKNQIFATQLINKMYGN